MSVFPQTYIIPSLVTAMPGPTCWPVAPQVTGINQGPCRTQLGDENLRANPPVSDDRVIRDWKVRREHVARNIYIAGGIGGDIIPGITARPAQIGSIVDEAGLGPGRYEPGDNASALPPNVVRAASPVIGKPSAGPDMVYPVKSTLPVGSRRHGERFVHIGAAEVRRIDQ